MSKDLQSPSIESGPFCLAVIPARSGSKRIPRKNVRNFHGKPLIAYTVEAALKSNLFARVIVSTEDPDIAEIAQQLGAEVPFVRSSGLADDFAPVSLATVDALERIDPEGSTFQRVAQLMPNCPLRTAGDVRESFRQFVETASDSQISVTRYGWQNPWWAMRRNRERVLQPLFATEATQRSQDLPELFCPTGAVWWGSAALLRREKTFHVQGRTGWEIPWQRAVDIDTLDDWAMAELLMEMSLLGSDEHGH